MVKLFILCIRNIWNQYIWYLSQFTPKISKEMMLSVIKSFPTGNFNAWKTTKHKLHKIWHSQKLGQKSGKQAHPRTCRYRTSFFSVQCSMIPSGLCSHFLLDEWRCLKNQFISPLLNLQSMQGKGKGVLVFLKFCGIVLSTRYCGECTW